MTMKKAESRLANSVARQLPVEKLCDELTQCFADKKRRLPSEEERKGLREAAEWIKGNLAQWTRFERGINDDTWDPVEGARSIFSDG